MKKFFCLLMIFFLAQAVGDLNAFADTKKNEEEKLEILTRQISFFKGGLQSKPHDPNLHFQLGTKFYELGRYYESQSDRIIFSGDNNADRIRARRLYRGSIEHLKKSLQIQPRNAGAHFNISLTYLVDGDGEKRDHPYARI